MLYQIEKKRKKKNQHRKEKHKPRQCITTIQQKKTQAADEINATNKAYNNYYSK